MTIRLSSTLLCILVYVSGCCQLVGNQAGVRGKIQVLTDSIASNKMLCRDAVGLTGAKTPQWERFEQLKKQATTDELKLLTNDARPVVRCYAFLALAGRKNENVFPILIQHLNDTAKLTTFSGCIVDSRMAGDYFLDVVTPGYIDPKLYKLPAKEKKTVDSILLADPTIRLSARAQLLKTTHKN